MLQLLEKHLCISGVMTQEFLQKASEIELLASLRAEAGHLRGWGKEFNWSRNVLADRDDAEERLASING